ncbi:hypothetical protein IWX49DRAFT_572153 [Phyllosticta citricarpa]|uniref:Uncharacterized protein n=1 Tax=Phyllosticta citricarpa TaxID=55181 RepID=A0ABR1LEG0_9PEZI
MTFCSLPTVLHFSVPMSCYAVDDGDMLYAYDARKIVMQKKNCFLASESTSLQMSPSRHVTFPVCSNASNQHKGERTLVRELTSIHSSFPWRRPQHHRGNASISSQTLLLLFGQLGHI